MKGKNRPDQTIKKIAIGSGIAAAAGYVVGILTAPKSGKEVREDIKDATDKSRSESEKELKKLHTELAKLINESKEKKAPKAKAEVRELLERAVETKEKVREVLSALHEGDAEDHDLKKALKNASDALDHLKEYLKK